MKKLVLLVVVLSMLIWAGNAIADDKNNTPTTVEECCNVIEEALNNRDWDEYFKLHRECYPIFVENGIHSTPCKEQLIPS